MSGNVPKADAVNADAEQVKSFRDFLISYNKLSELCFNDCIWDFTSRTVKAQEDRCALNCMEKYLRMNQRISQRFQEFQILANENAMALAQKSGTISRWYKLLLISHTVLHLLPETVVRMLFIYVCWIQELLVTLDLKKMQYIFLDSSFVFLLHHRKSINIAYFSALFNIWINKGNTCLHG